MTQTDTSHRLNKHLALQMGISRREADLLIEKGKVQVNDATVRLGAHISSGDKIIVDGKPISPDSANLEYLLMNKPVGYVCSRKTQGDAPTIYSLLPPRYHALKTVGRLDKNSSGIILLTNDGDFTHRMTHPSFQKNKIYNVRLDRELEPLHHQMINDHGVLLDDGNSQLTLMRLNDTNRNDWQVTMREGRNRQIRRTFSALGYEVTRLHRLTFGDYSLGDIKRGSYTILDIPNLI